MERLQIKSRLQEIFAAAEKLDLPRLDSYHLYGPKFTKFPAAPVGRQDAAIARQSEHDGLGAISALAMRADDLKIDVFGDVGIATFILHSRFTAGADPIERQERATLVFVKDHGVWKITHEHFSSFKVNPSSILGRPIPCAPSRCPAAPPGAERQNGCALHKQPGLPAGVVVVDVTLLTAWPLPFIQDSK